jgi:predicted NAD/FAD-binding protein
VNPESVTTSTPVTSARRMAAAAVLQASENLDNATMIAVVDAAARWLDEPDGEEYAYALLGAVTGGLTQLRAYGELVGPGSAATAD